MMRTLSLTTRQQHRFAGLAWAEKSQKSQESQVHHTPETATTPGKSQKSQESQGQRDMFHVMPAVTTVTQISDRQTYRFVGDRITLAATMPGRDP